MSMDSHQEPWLYHGEDEDAEMAALLEEQEAVERWQRWDAEHGAARLEDEDPF